MNDLLALAARATAAAAPVSMLGAIVMVGMFALVTGISIVAVCSTGERAENAIRVLKVLTRRKDPPGGEKD